MKYQEVQDIPPVVETPFTPRIHDPIVIPVATSTPDVLNSNQLHVGQSKNINGIQVTLNSIIQDSRCPIDVQCIQAGNITANLTLKSLDNVTLIQMISNQVYTFDSRSISITTVNPAAHSKTVINPKEYIVGFEVSKK
jgi:hypothetical protein